MLKLLGRNASNPASSEPKISITAAARDSPKPAPAIPAQPSPIIIERNAATESCVRRDSGDSLFEELGALGGDVEWLSPNKPAVTNADILSIQDSSYVPQAPLLHSAARRGSQCSTGGLPAPSGQGSAEGGYSPGNSDRYSPGSFLADPEPSGTFPATNRKLFSTGGEDDQSWLVAAPGGSDFGSTQEFMAGESSPRLGDQRQLPFNSSPSKLPLAPVTSAAPGGPGRTKIPKPAAGGASSAGGDLKKSRISKSSPLQQQPPDQQQLARRYEQAPSFIPGAPEGYVPSSHGSMSSMTPSLAEAPAGGEAADAAVPATAGGGDAGGGEDFERSQSHDSFEEAERMAAQAERPDGSRAAGPREAVTAAAAARPTVAPSAVPATVAPPAVTATAAPPAVAAMGSAPLPFSKAPAAVSTEQPNDKPAAAPTESEPPPSFQEPCHTAGVTASERASHGTAPTASQKPAAAAADDKVKKRGCLCFKW